MQSTYNTVIIGSGAAGMSLSLYLSRAGIKHIIIESSAPGGQLNKIVNIENYPGIKSIDGPTFAYNLYTQITDLQVQYIHENVLSINKKKGYHEVITTNNIIKAKYVVIASGRKPRELPIDNIEKYIGNGISYCALCDGAFYKNKDVIVVGGGRSALEEALYLSNICNKVTIIHRKNFFTAEEITINEIKNKKNIDIIYNTNIKEIKEENNKIYAIKTDNNKEILTNGIFVCIGYIPNTSFIDIVGKENNYILVNKKFETNIKRIYAIGDVIKKDLYQITSAVNDALIVANELIKKNNS